MKKILVHCVVALLLLLCTDQVLFAGGFGVNRTVAALPARPLQLSYPRLLDKLIGKMQGIDIVYDSAVAKDQIFNYRANIECDTITKHINTLFASKAQNTNIIVFSNTFGFGFLRTSFIRLWAGPQISIAYEFINKNSRIYNSVIYTKFGAVAGVNIHTSDDITIGVEFGFRSGFGYDLTRSSSSAFTSAKLEPIATMKLIFRAWDFYPSGV